MRRTVIATLALAVAGYAGAASAQTVKTGTISADETWGSGSNLCPIILDGPVVIGDGVDESPAVAGNYNEKVTLTILPGCIVRGQPRTAAGAAGAPGSLTVSTTGRLIANGQNTAATTIIMTTAATDNNADGNPDRSGGFLEPWDSGDTFFDDLRARVSPANVDLTQRRNPLVVAVAEIFAVHGDPADIDMIGLGAAHALWFAGQVPTDGMKQLREATSPDVVGRNDEIILKSVDLPAPFGPITDKISFSSTSNVMLWFAVRPPNRLVTALTSTSELIVPPPIAYRAGY